MEALGIRREFLKLVTGFGRREHRGRALLVSVVPIERNVVLDVLPILIREARQALQVMPLIIRDGSPSALL